MSTEDPKTPETEAPQEGASSEEIAEMNAETSGETNAEVGGEADGEKQKAPVAGSSMPTAVEPEELKETKSPTGKIAVLAVACIVVLALSIWGLVSAMGAGTPEDSAQGQTRSERAAQGSSGSESSGSASDAADSDEESASSTEQDSTVTEQSRSNGTVNTGQGGGGTNSTNTPNTSQDQEVNITFSITCYEAVAIGNATAIAVSDNGAMYSVTMRLDAGTSVYDALVASGASIGSSTSTLGVYVKSINGLAEYDAGGESGWKYFINGSEPQTSCNKYILQNGDTVEWRFALER